MDLTRQVLRLAIDVARVRTPCGGDICCEEIAEKNYEIEGLKKTKRLWSPCKAVVVQSMHSLWYFKALRPVPPIRFFGIKNLEKHRKTFKKIANWKHIENGKLET